MIIIACACLRGGVFGFNCDDYRVELMRSSQVQHQKCVKCETCVSSLQQPDSTVSSGPHDHTLVTGVTCDKLPSDLLWQAPSLLLTLCLMTVFNTIIIANLEPRCRERRLLFSVGGELQIKLNESFHLCEVVLHVSVRGNCESPWCE